MIIYPLGASLTLADLEGDPHPVLHRLRAEESVSWVPAFEAWLVTRRDDVIDVMRDAKTYTVDHPGFSTGQVVGPSMLSRDGSEHLRHRAPFEKPFRRREVEQRFDTRVAEAVTALVDDLVSRKEGQAELRREFAGPVAVKTMMVALGIDDIPVELVLRWYDIIVQTVTEVTAGQSVSLAGRAAFGALRDSLLPALRRQPDSSLLAAAGAMAQGLSDDEIISNAAILLFGGIETTEGMIANALYYLLLDPALRDAVRADPSLVQGLVEESLRMEPAATVLDRYATRNVRLGQAEIKAGDLVRVSLAAIQKLSLSRIALTRPAKT